jgi:hypothetical protein
MITGRHPVRTGRARAGWYPSVVGLGGNFDFSSGLKDDDDTARGKREGSFINKLKNSSNKYVVLINSVRYIVYLEYGHSKQAPFGMVRISMRKMRGALPDMLDETFQKDWAEFKFS